MKKLMLLFGVLVTAILNAQNTYRLSGKVMDENQLPLAFCNVQLGDFHTTTDHYGKFHFHLPDSGSFLLSVSYIGFEPYQELRSVRKNHEHVHITLQSAAANLDEVVISDHYAQQLKQKESRPVSVINQDFINRNMGGSLMQSLENLPGVSSIDIGSGQSKPVIRGLSFNRVVVVDHGVKHESQQWGVDHGLEVDQLSVERIEVIKGPAAIHYGSDAMGGLIKLSSSFVPERFTSGGRAQFLVKTNNNLFGGGVLAFNRQDHFYVKLKLNYQYFGDYKVPTDEINYASFVIPLHKGTLRNTAGREANAHLNLGWNYENFKTDFLLSQVFTRNGYFANAHGLEVRDSDLDFDASSFDIDLPFQQVYHTKLINQSKWRLNRGILEWEAGFQYNHRSELAEAVAHNDMPQPPDTLERRFEKYTSSVNMRYVFPKYGLHQLTIGSNLQYVNNFIGGWGFIIPSFREFAAGLSATDNWQLNSKWNVHFGIRLDHTNLDTDAYYDWYLSPITENQLTTGYEYKQRSQDLDLMFASWSASFGAVYLSGNWRLNFNLGRSFRAPEAHELASDGIHYHYFRYEKGNPDLQPEIAYQMDVGAAWEHAKFKVEASPFVSYFSNYIFLSPLAEYDDGMQVYVYTDTEVFRWGAEAGFTFKASRQLETSVMGEAVFAEQLSGDKKGFGLPFMPAPQLLFQVKYMPKPKGAFHDTYFNLDYRISAEQTAVLPPELITPAWQVVNVSFGTLLMINHFEMHLQMQVRNLFNTFYFNHTSFYRIIAVPEPGRNFVVSISIPFGHKH